jgi:heptosyltransferase-2
MLRIKKILIRFPNWLGDLVMALPLVEELKKHYPEAQIHALIKTPFDQLLKHDTRFDKIISFKKQNSFFKKLFPIHIQSLVKKEGYDLAILCTRSLSSALELSFSKIPQKIGAQRPLSSFLLTHPLKLNKKLHQRQQYLSLLKPLGIESQTVLTPLEKSFQETPLIKFGLKSTDAYVVLHPGASYGFAKTWPLDCFKKLSALLLLKTSYKVVICGDVLQKKIPLEDPRLLDLTGKTDLMDLKHLLENAKLVICNDSGPMHIADALKTPLIGLFGPTDPVLTGPKNKDSLVIHHPTSCGPCFQRQCHLDHACMKQISPEEVLEKALTLLGEYGSS